MWLRTRIVSCVSLVLAAAAAIRADVKVGDVFPRFASMGVVNLAGGDVPATTGHVMLVDFWASWCAPCKASFPAMAKIYADYSSRGLVVAAVSVDEKPANAVAFWKKMAPPFITLHDRGQNLVKEVVVPTMPSSYVLGRDGKVRFIHEGFHGDPTDREIRREIELLLAEKDSTP